MIFYRYLKILSLRFSMNKSTLLIGNGGSLSRGGLGSKIDEFDEVIRINEGKTKGWEQDAGMKFTIWSTYNPQKKFFKFINGYRSRGYSDDMIKDLLKDIHEIWYVAPRFDLLIPWKFDNLTKKDTIIRHMSPRILREITSYIKEPTTGFILIYLLNKMYDKFYITGFDFLGHSKLKPVLHHYFTDNPLERAESKEILIRDLDGEYQYTQQLVDNGEVEYLTKDTEIVKSQWKYADTRPVSTMRECINGHKSMYYWWENKICHICEEMCK
jgi:hypothetical protein